LFYFFSFVWAIKKELVGIKILQKQEK